MGYHYSKEEVVEALTAVIAWAGNISAAHRYLGTLGNEHVPGPRAISEWIHGPYSEMFMQMREDNAQKQEAQLIHMYRDAAAQATNVALDAVDRSKERLQSGKDQDPSRTAANLATVADKMTTKMLALSGRPTSIREDRNLNEVLRSLVGKGILQMPDSPVQLTEGNVEEVVSAGE